MRSSLSLHRDPTLLRDCPPSTNTFSLWEALNWGLGSWEKISSTCLLFWPGVCTPRLASSLRVQVPDPCYKLADAEKVLLTAGTNLLTTDRGQQPPPRQQHPSLLPTFTSLLMHTPFFSASGTHLAPLPFAWPSGHLLGILTGLCLFDAQAAGCDNHL